MVERRDDHLGVPLGKPLEERSCRSLRLTSAAS
jgi:hypothetical protein